MKLLHSKKIQILLFIGSILCCSFAGITKVSAQENILVIHSYNEKTSWTRDIKKGIDETLVNDTTDIQVFHEFLDAKTYPKLHHSQVFLDYIQSKYRHTNLDLLMVSDDPGLEIVAEYRKKYFADLPIVYLGINHIESKILNLPNATGVFENRDATETIIEASRQTNSDQVIVINDTTQTGKANLAQINKCSKLNDCFFKLRIFNDLTPGNIQDTLGKYSQNIPILLIGQLRKKSSQGGLYSFKKGAQILNSQLANPIYGLNLDLLNQETVGGKFLEGTDHAKQAMIIVEEILQGTSADQIKPIFEAENKWIFDAKELEKFNIELTKLPKDSKLINQHVSFYQKNKKLVWFTASIFGVSLLIIFLLIEVIRQGEITKRILSDNESRYKDLAESGAHVFWELDTNSKISYISGDTDFFCKRAISEILGKSIQELFKDDPNVDFPWESFEANLENYQPIKNLIYKVKQPNQELQIFQLNGKPIYDKNNHYLGYRGIKRAITQEYNLSQTIAYQASYDFLTGLHNRREFIGHLKGLVDETKNYPISSSSVLCYLDLDRFKLVNDTAGHLVGDSLLIVVTKIITSCLREQDILGRLGGDEFGLLLKRASILDAQKICQEIINRVSENRFQWHNRFFDIGISIGIISITNKFDTIELLSKADLACYRAKDLGRGIFCIAGKDNTDLNNVQMEMEYISSVSQAIEQQKFYLVKQQIKSIDQYDVYEHYEILLRYKDQNGKNISPGLFIPAAEKYGVITIIDRWVLETIVKNYNSYFPDGQTMISVNISGISISSNDFTEFVLNLFSSSNIDLSYICLEITETAAISQLSQALKFISTMKKLNVKFALDDFGSGLSSFSYLKDLPIDYLKIDGSLIKNIVTEASDLAIVEAVNSIAKNLQIKTIAEFVENEQIHQVLGKIGIDYAQGYSIHKPAKCLTNKALSTISIY